MKCGQPLRTSPGLLVAGQSAASAISPSTQPASRRVVQPGGFFPRLIAIIIDSLILGVVMVPIAYLVLVQGADTHAAAGQSNAFLDQLKGLSGSGSAFTAERLTQLLELAAGIAILQLFYYVGCWSILGGSPGQLVMSLRIVDASAKTVGFGRALLRYLMKGLFGALLPISALMVALGKDKRAIHDYLAGTYVIQFLDPKLEDFDAVLAPAQDTLPPPSPTPVTSPVAQEMYTGAVLAAAAVGGPEADPELPSAPAGPPLPAAPPPPGGEAPVPPSPPMAPVPAPPMAPAAPDQSAFERYSSPAVQTPVPEPAPAATPAPAPAPTPARPPAPNLPIFPTSDPGGYQPMAPAPRSTDPAAPPSAPADPGSSAPAHQPQPYALPFAPRVSPTPAEPPPQDPPADSQP